MAATSIDAIVTDPPYEIGFMSHKWDTSQVAFDPETWRAALRVLRPGAFALIFGGTRTYHRMACAVEDAGFEVKDCISWMQGQGMPKGWNFTNRVPLDRWCACAEPGVRDGGACSLCGRLHPDFHGFDVALKPAMELICVARKPLAEPTILANVLAHGTGALNIDATRGETDSQRPGNAERAGEASAAQRYADRGATNFAAKPGVRGGSPDGRWTPNVALDEEAASALDEQSGIRKSGAMPGAYIGFGTRGIFGESGLAPRNVAASSGGASRFMFTAKAPAKERTLGMPDGERCAHPTQKPLALMKWLVTLVTPPGGTVLDPFCGSGTTGIAAEALGFHFVGIDLHYADLANTRLLALRERA